MEERLCISAARLGHETADGQKMHQIAEHRALEARIQEECSRKSTQEPHALAYDSVEVGMSNDQAELSALTACMREISRALEDPGAGDVANTLDPSLEPLQHSRPSQGD